jgi:iron complex outermembrane recepter protein
MTSKQHRRGAATASEATRYALLAPALAAAGLAGPVQHAAAADAERTITLEEVVVTANRREQSLLEVPQAISALPESFLESLGADRFSDYARFVPGLEFAEFSPGQTRITIRGISNELSVGVPTVSYYVDEIAITSPLQTGQPDFKLYDIERVEVLRGPQGTIYGEGSLGGTVRVITRKPDTENFEGSAELSYGSIRSGEPEYGGNAMVNIPLVPGKLAARVVGIYRDEGGWIDNVAPGFEQKDTNAARTRGGRIALLFTPTDQFTLTGTMFMNRLEVDNANVINSGTDFSGQGLTRRADDYDLYNLTADYRFGGFTLTSSSSYVTRPTDSIASDPAATLGTINFIGSLLGSTPVTRSLAISSADTKAFTQEIRLVSSAEQRLRWIVGGFYRDIDAGSPATRVTTPAMTFGPGNPYGQPAGAAVPGGILTNESQTDFENIAAFGELTYALTDRLDFSLGARWFDETQDVLRGSSGALVGFTNGVFTPAPFIGENSDSGVTYRGSLSLQIDPSLLLYASISSGFRSGGVNTLTLLPGIPATYDSDETINYEAGVKLAAAGGRVQLNAALYYIDWHDFQIEEFSPTLSVAFLSNLGQAHSAGVEVELRAQPTDNLTLTASGTLQESETDTSFQGSSGGVVEEGARLPFTSKYKFAFAADYVFPLGGSRFQGVLHGDVSRVGDSVSRLEPGVNEAFGFGTNELDAYTLVNLRAGVESERYGVYAFLNNADDVVAQLADDNFGGHYRNKPRTLGITVTARF